METPEEREHGYDDEEEQRAYEQRGSEEQAAGDEDAGPASRPGGADPAEQDDD